VRSRGESIYVLAVLAGCSPLEKLDSSQPPDLGRGVLIGAVTVTAIKPSFEPDRSPWLVAVPTDPPVIGEPRDVHLVADIDHSGVFVLPNVVSGEYALTYVIPSDSGTCVFRTTAKVYANLITLREDRFEPKLGSCRICTFAKPNANSCN
jgi:hypothetical protein